ncbi:DapH/DapD/GlmU-related protein [Leptolyngbya sp. FACHB-16]|uniref:acyltransferase n=1 Tax=unclassified Leptolyngbya TaxID=2650499 RepID=UPI00168974CE|nr:DapH/DapD/GlmU-related protein [Leptolyngbya sp. FACHB-16]MBD2156187.1 acetyltransferase [Leptolyngbya sp. FACHB-16]
MTWKLTVGQIMQYSYNQMVGKIPSRTIRNAYLEIYLGGMGTGVSVQLGCRFLNGRKVYLGDRTILNFGCLFDGRTYPIHIGNDVSIGPEATLLTLGHDPYSPDFADKGGEVVIGDRVWIAYRAIILPGITVGEGAVVGAGAVVTKNVEAYTIVAGNPARVIGKRSPHLTYTLNYKPWLL